MYCACSYIDQTQWLLLSYLFVDKLLIHRNCLNATILSIVKEFGRIKRSPLYVCKYWLLLECVVQVVMSVQRSYGLHSQRHFARSQDLCVRLRGPCPSLQRVCAHSQSPRTDHIIHVCDYVHVDV